MLKLYRKDATGELVGLASPLPGYTEIQQFPTDIKSRSIWYRQIDTYGQVSEWHPSELQDTPETPGTDTRAGSGINILPNDYCSFEWEQECPPIFASNATVNRIDTAWHGKYGIRVQGGGAGAFIRMADGDKFNIDIEPGKKWIFSLYTKNFDAISRSIRVVLDDGQLRTELNLSTSKDTIWTRLDGIFDLTGGTAKTARLVIYLPSVPIMIDALMLEEQVGPLRSPSTFRSPWSGVTPVETLPDYGIGEWALTKELNARIDMIDRSGDGTIDARIKAVKDELQKEIDAIENGVTDIAVVTPTGSTTLRGLKTSSENALAAIIQINTVTQTSGSVSARTLAGLVTKINDPISGIESKASIAQLNQAKSDIFGAQVSAFRFLDAEFQSKQAQINARATILQLEQAKTDIYGSAVSRFTNIQAQFNSVFSNLDLKAGVTQMNTAIATAKGEAIAQATQQVYTSLGGSQSTVETKARSWDGVAASYVVKIDNNGYISGYGLYSAGNNSQFLVNSDAFAVGKGGVKGYPFYVDGNTGSVYMYDAFVRNLTASKITSGTINAASITLNGGAIQSLNYSPGVRGWRINGDGSAEFLNVTVRGRLDARDLQNFIPISALQDGSITAAKIANISADKITTGTLNCQYLTVRNLSADSMTVGTLRLGPGGLNISGFIADYIGSGTIDFSKIVAKNISAASITTGTLDASRINVTNLSANSIKSGTIVSQDIVLSGGSIRAANGGWSIDGYGNAVFNTAIIRSIGNISPNILSKTTTLQYSGAIKSGSGLGNRTYIGGHVFKHPPGTIVTCSAHITLDTSAYMTELLFWFGENLWTIYRYKDDIATGSAKTYGARAMSASTAATFAVPAGGTFFMWVQARHGGNGGWTGDIDFQFTETLA